MDHARDLLGPHLAVNGLRVVLGEECDLLDGEQLLLLGLLDKAGVPVDSFGDSTGRVDLEPLSLTSDI